MAVDPAATPPLQPLPPLPPLPRLEPAGKLCPRVTWTVLHTIGLGLLWLSGRWQPLDGHWSLPLDGPSIGTNLIDKLLLLTLLLYVLSATSDPGYVLPENDEMPANDVERRRPQPLDRPLIQLPQCPHCTARQPARTKHCHECGRCVRRMDHHCWWLGNCVGANNHRLFLAFVTCETSLVCLAAVTATGIFGDSYYVPAGGDGDDDGDGGSSTLAGVCASLALGMCSVLGLLSLTLLIFQCGLIARGETTWEYLKREQLNAEARRPADARPYDRSACQNCVNFAFAKTATIPIAPAVAVLDVCPPLPPRPALIVGEPIVEEAHQLAD